MVEGGAFDNEMEDLSAALTPYGFGCDAMNEYAALWNWPNGYASGRNVFTGGMCVASASECISIAPVLGKFLREVVLPAGVLV